MPSKRGSPAETFRRQIDTAVADGATLGDLTLRLTLSDVSQLKRDQSLAISDISYADGEMRFLGVKVEQGGVPASELIRG